MVHLIGNAHLDPAWMWRMDEGLESFMATCRSALDRMQEFPDLIFTCSSATHYAFIEETDPPLFTRIQAAVKAGRWSVVGGWWVEADCNLPSGESFVRQALIGQQYFQSRFGKIATVGYNIDSFGHNGNLPQLLRKSGIESYVFMRPEQDEKPLASALFLWEAPTGDRVTAYRLPLHYSSYTQTVREKLASLPRYELYRSDRSWMIFFGVGNHGGGPTIEQLNLIEELRNERDDVIYSSPEQFFENVDALSLPIIRDEMQPHAIGCYSAHSEIKQLHRKTENDLLRDERFAVLAALLGNTSQLEPLDRAWKNLCFNQFHDLLGGVAIQAACEDAISMYREAIAIAEKNTRHTVQRIAARIDTRDFIENIVVFNPSAFAREETIEFEIWNPDASERGELVQSAGLVASDGTLMPAQKIEPSGKIGEDRVRFASIVSVPALGWATFGIERNTKLDFPSDIKISSRQITNGLITFAHPAILNKGEDRNMATASEYVEYMPAILIEDDSDTWSHGLHAFNGKRKQFEIIEVQHIEEGPLRAGVRIVSKSGEARLEEEYFVSKGSPVIEVRVHIESFEKRKIIKLRFPHKCKNPVARYEIPYASIERPIGRNEWPGQSWVDVSERDGSRGLSLITDSKYSYSADEECIQVIAARSPLYAHHEPPHIVQTNERLRFLDQGVQEFRMLLVPHEGDWRTPDLQGYSEQLHQPLIAHTESSHAGNLPKIFSGFISVTPGIQIGAIKMTEMGDGIIVRAIESLGERATTSFQFPSRNIQWQSDFSPFEIKSFRIEGNIVTEVDLLERPL